MKRYKKKRQNLSIVPIIVILLTAFGIYFWQKNISSTNGDLDKQENVSIKIEANNNEQLAQSPKEITAGIITNVGTTTPSSEPLSYIGDKEKITALREVNGVFNYKASDLRLRAEECGNFYPQEYFEKLVLKFDKSQKFFYTFEYNTANASNSDGSVYSVTILPNKAGYKTMDEFKKDFNLCAGGGEDNPLMMNKDWLLFVSSCGSGFDDGSGRINGCEVVRKLIEPTLKLK